MPSSYVLPLSLRSAQSALTTFVETTAKEESELSEDEELVKAEKILQETKG